MCYSTEFEAMFEPIVEVEMRSSAQPLPDLVGVLNGLYLLGSHESSLIWMTSAREYYLIDMETLAELCSETATSSSDRDAELIAASQPYTP